MANRALLNQNGLKILDTRTLDGRELVAVYDTTKHDCDTVSRVTHQFIPRGWRTDPGRPYNIQAGRFTIPIKQRQRTVGR